jgi:hypothetical protein
LPLPSPQLIILVAGGSHFLFALRRRCFTKIVGFVPSLPSRHYSFHFLSPCIIIGFLAARKNDYPCWMVRQGIIIFDLISVITL